MEQPYATGLPRCLYCDASNNNLPEVVQQTRLTLTRFQRHVDAQDYETRRAFQELESDMKRELTLLRRRLAEDLKNIHEAQTQVLEACETLNRQQKDFEKRVQNNLAGVLTACVFAMTFAGFIAVKVVKP